MQSSLKRDGLRRGKNLLASSSGLSASGFSVTQFFSVLDSNDVEVFSHAGIEQEIVQFYSNLFSSEPIDTLCKQTCLSSIENHLDFSQRQSCEGFLSLQELSDAVKTLNLGKSPGSDGFSAKFYLHF